MQTENNVVDELAGVTAETGPSVQRGLFSMRRVKGRGAWDGDCFHVMSRTCGGAVFFDEVEPSGARLSTRSVTRRVNAEAFIKRNALWRMAAFCPSRRLTA